MGLTRPPGTFAAALLYASVAPPQTFVRECVSRTAATVAVTLSVRTSSVCAARYSVKDPGAPLTRSTASSWGTPATASLYASATAGSLPMVDAASTNAFSTFSTPAATGLASVLPTMGTFSICRCKDSNLPLKGQGMRFASSSHVAGSAALSKPVVAASSRQSFMAAAAFFACSSGDMASMALMRAISSGDMEPPPLSMPKLIMPPPMDTPSPPMAARAAPAAASSAEAPAPMSFVAGVLPLCYVTPGAAGACSRGAGSGTALRSVGTLRNSSGVAGGAGRRICSGLAARFCCGAEASFS